MHALVHEIICLFILFQLSYIATTSTTVDNDLFPTLFRINQILSDLNPLRIKMMKYFNWTRVGTIFTQDEQSLPVCFSLIYEHKSVHIIVMHNWKKIGFIFSRIHVHVTTILSNTCLTESI